MASYMTLLVTLAAACSVAHAGCTVGTTTCYADTPARILGTQNYNSGSKTLSNEYCASVCHTNGFKLAGSEYGIECYCGNEIAPSAKPSSSCNMNCGGVTKETCGGNYAIDIFAVNCTGDPVPHPDEPAELVNPCLNATGPWKDMPFCDATLDIDDRVKDAISRMTLDEKITNLGTGGGAIAGLGIPKYNWWSEATHGVATGRFDGSTPYTTNFPFPITTGMSFNRTLWWKTGNQIAREARAMMNAGSAYSTFWAPVINLAREPRWGRNIETPGEDPYLTGEYAVSFVKGFQEAPEDPFHVQASACCKHYVANSMESTTQQGYHNDRHHFDAYVPMQDLMDSYMPPFQACVEQGEVTGLMCSYNAVNGVPSCANDWLLTDVARKEWGFDGYITSDCDADADVFNDHKYNPTPEETVRDVLRAGTDVDCGGFVSQHAASALNKSIITEGDIDERLSYLFRMRFRLSHFDPVGPLDKIPVDVICSEYARDTARDAVAQSVTLLKNSDKLLPLEPSTTAKFAVIGPNANLSQSLAGYYGPSHPCNNSFPNMVDAVAMYAPQVVSVLGVPSVLSDDVSQIPAAVAMAKDVDTVILTLGTDLSAAREGSDAVNISFSFGQQQLIEQVVEAAKNPVIVVTLTAVPLDISSLLDNPKIGAVVHAGQPSVQTLGVGDVLFGKKVPAGRTIQTIYPGSYQDEVSIFDFGMRPGPSNFPRPDCTQPFAQCPNATNPGRTHRFYTGKPVVPFGFGLSYTTFSYAVSGQPQEAISLDTVRDLLAQTTADGRSFPRLSLGQQSPMVNYTVTVTNTGSVDADDVVLGMLTPPGAGTNGVPLQQLFGFERIHVPAGKSVTVFIYPALLDFTTVDASGQRQVLSGEYKIRYGVEATARHGQGFTEFTLQTV